MARITPTLLLKDVGGLFLYYPGQAGLNRLPPSALRAVARVGGGVVRRLGNEDMVAELRAIYQHRPMPRSETAILRDAFRLTMYNEMEILRYPFLNPQTIADTVTLEGQAHIEEALQQKKGVILLIGHFGANQMIMPALGHLGYPMNQLSAPPPVWAEILRETRTTPLWEKILARRWALEKKLPVQHINIFRFLRPAFDCLARNEVLGLAFDGGGGKKWVKVNFLGRSANFSAEPARIWQKTGAVLLPTFVTRAPHEGRHRIVITPPLPWAGDATTSLQNFAARFEQRVWEQPEEYLYFLALRRKVRGTDVRPFFDDYPPAKEQLSPEEAESRLKVAGAWRDPEDAGA